MYNNAFNLHILSVCIFTDNHIQYLCTTNTIPVKLMYPLYDRSGAAYLGEGEGGEEGWDGVPVRDLWGQVVPPDGF